MLNGGTIGPGGTFLGGGFLTSGWFMPVARGGLSSAFSQSTHTVHAMTYMGVSAIKRVKGRTRGQSQDPLLFDREWNFS